MKSTTKRSLVLLLATLVMLSVMSVAALNVSAATAPADGMTFVQDSYFEMTKVTGVSETLTIEASVWIAHNAGDGRHGTVIGNYSDDPQFGGVVPVKNE